MVTDNLEIIYESENTIIYKGVYEGESILVKSLRTEYPSLSQLNRLRNEYELTKRLTVNNVRKALTTKKIKSRETVVFSYFDGDTIKNTLARFQDTLTFLETAKNIAGCLSEIHDANIVHKDINSNNILVDELNNICIIDFEISSIYNLKSLDLGNPNRLEGTLPYISPEQTGRMNRTVNYSTDLYSLGVTFYEMLTGQLPFISQDPMEVVYAHIAKMPKPPKAIIANIPAVVSDIVMKLMSKSPENRYKSAGGLKKDIEKCILLLGNKTQLISTFKLAEKDFSNRLIIQEKLYGREFELKKLFNLYNKVINGSTELLVISGYSGVGKTSFVNEIHSSIAQHRGIYLEGKFGQFLKNIPYFALIEMFNGFIDIVLSEDDESLNYWKDLIQEAVGDIGQVLMVFFPKLELIIGKQPTIPTLTGDEARNRLNHVWSSLIKAICKRNHPVVMFLDDLQWADNESLELLKTLINDTELCYLLCITAYRNNEVSSSHPLTQFYQNLDDKHLNVSNITFTNLDQEDIYNFLSDTLKFTDTHEEALLEQNKLSELIYSKTLGNPFFTIQVLQTLHESELLYFNRKTEQWEWLYQRIKQLKITDNVIDLLSSKINKLSPKTLEITKIASCFGNEFELSLLAKINNKDEEITKRELEESIIENMIIPSGFEKYQFVHDRFRQAVYDSISEYSKIDLHYNIGKLLLKHIPREEREEQVFDIVNQLNLGIPLIIDQKARRRLAIYNIIAGKRAETTVAFDAAFNYLKIALSLIDKYAWTTDYKFVLGVYEEYSKFAYLTGRYDIAEITVKEIIKNVHRKQDIVKSYLILINANRAQTKYKQALEIGSKLLNDLGITIVEKPSKYRIAVEFLKVRFLLKFTNPEKILNNKRGNDDTLNTAFKLFDPMVIAAYHSDPYFLKYLILKILSLIRRYKYTENLTFYLITYAGLMIDLGNYKEGLHVLDIATPILDRATKDKKQDSNTQRSLFLISYFIKPWTQKLDAFNNDFLDIYRKCIDIGDIEYASYALANSLLFKFFAGHNLSKILRFAIQDYNTIKKLKQEFSLVKYQTLLQFIDNLTHEKEKPKLLIGKYFNEDTEVNANDAYKNLGNEANIYLYKIVLNYLWADFTTAYNLAIDAQKYVKETRAAYINALHNFYFSLSALSLASYSSMNTSDYERYLTVVTKNQRRLKLWAKHCPENFLNKYYLVEAERLRVRGKKRQAREYYDKAIIISKDNNLPHEEAICYELTAYFYIQQNIYYLASFYMQNAWNCYHLWGAEAKAKSLKDHYPELIISKTEKHTLGQTGSIASTTSSSFAASLLDIKSIIKASQSLSGEIKLDKLVTVMLKIVMENAGAQKGVLLSNNKGKYKVMAEGYEAGKTVNLVKFRSFENYNDLPKSVVKYIIRTQKSLVIDNAQNNKNFIKDHYIVSRNVKSILCHPVVRKRKLIAIIYLENNLSSSAFKRRHIDIVNILSAQIAISFENSSLYENLEEMVDSRTIELKDAYKELQHKNTEVEESHKNISDSINYARRIQEALLPTDAEISKCLPENFVIWKPRDVVSGDFYWFKEITHKDELFYLILVADCTGHGVPGAFVSMLGVSYLNEIVRYKSVWESENKASELLHQLRIKVITAFEQKGNIEERKDGMDVSLCVINVNKGILHYAGAFNPLWIIRNASLPTLDTKVFKSENRGNYQLSHIKADAMPIGIYSVDSPFTNHKIQLQKGDFICMFTDGYSDQMGGKKGKKFLIKRLRSLFLDIHEKPLAEQKEILEENFDKWKKGFEQMDDVLIISFRYNQY